MQIATSKTPPMDIITMADICHEAWQAYDWLDEEFKQNMQIEKLEQNRYLTINNINYLTLYTKDSCGVVSCFADINISNPNRMEIKTFYVDRVLTGQKIGTNFMQEIEFFVAKLGCKELYVVSVAANTGALRFYKRLGFEEILETSVLIGGKEYPSIGLLKSIS